jgi:hypothetical protein
VALIAKRLWCTSRQGFELTTDVVGPEMVRRRESESALCCVAEKEFRELTREEEVLLRLAEAGGEGTPVSEHPIELLHSLYRRQLVYFDIPVSKEQRFSTSSLDGFVSNRDLVAGDSDPMEALLYEIFVSNSERLRLVELADVLEKDLKAILHAMSIAVRMGFAVLIDGMVLHIDHQPLLIVSPCAFFMCLPTILDGPQL